MKLILILIALISVVVNGLNSYHLFRVSSYDLSSLLIIASYLSIVMGIYVLTTKKAKPAAEKINK
ncbi:MAG TPA: hypothetical protein VI233_17845 [Puia sp.]